MYFNGKRERDAILKQEEARGYFRFAPPAKRFRSYINLCIHPYTWEETYISVKSRVRIPLATWNALMGVIMGLLVNAHKKSEHTIPMIAEVAIDFIEYIRMDKGSDPWAFLLSMKRYLPRYCLIKSLRLVGIEWQTVAYDLMGARSKFAYTSYHTLFTNPYVRTLVKGTTVFKRMRRENDPDYEAGVNDKHTLLLKESASTKCLSYEALENVVNLYLECLPSWNASVRSSVCYYISFLRPLHELVEKQMSPTFEYKTLGTKYA